MEMTLAHELQLLSLDPRSGARRSSQGVSFAVVTMELVELAVRGRIGMMDDKLVVVDPSPVGNRCLDDLLRTLVQDGKPRKPQRVVEKFRRGRDLAVIAELEATGAVRGQQDQVLGIFPVSHHVPNPDALAAVRRDLDAGLAQSRWPARTLALLGGLEVARLEKQLLGDGFRAVRARAHDESERGGVSVEVAAIIRGGRKARESSESSAAAAAS